MRHTVPTPAKRCRGMKNAPDAMSGAHKAGAEALVLLGAAAGGSGEADGADGQQAERCRLWRFHFRRYMHGKSIGNAGVGHSALCSGRKEAARSRARETSEMIGPALQCSS